MKTKDGTEVTHAFAVPGSDNLIDVVNPHTQCSAIGGETADQIAIRYPGAVMVNLAEFLDAKARAQDVPVIWSEVTEEQFNDMFEVLPPAAYAGAANAFLVGEPQDHHATNGQPRFDAFKEDGGKFWSSSRPMTRAEFRGLFMKSGAGKNT